ncbi:M48 family metalloprotease [Qipengyuania sediminis]|uniref:M48 family metalloprotease n=1 Tax=Qipengyuania sediminis TaxID=1532023 RepID=UPI001F0F1F70|nr:M48 family metalloprotease [Qipengyuania sediminis]
MTTTTRARMTRTIALASAGALALAGAANAQSRRPATTPQITQAEAQQGAQANQQILQEFGGAMTGPQAQYVETIGKNIAVQSGLGNAREAFRVAMLDSSVNNAFAIPGGYIYTTRQLVALMNNEAELAGVLGHEVAHVAARHSQRRQQTAQRNSILGAIGSVLSGVLLGNSQIGQAISSGLQQGSQLLTLRFSRTQELEADDLGQQYLVRAGYDPNAMATVLASLAAQNSLDARLQGRGDAQVPAWASTHPDPASRVASATKRAAGRGGMTNRDTFLSRIDGLVYGDDPKQGVIEGRRFIHPELRLSFEAPNGFYMVNGTTAVSINGQSGQAQLTLAPYNGSLETYVASVFQRLGQNSQLAPGAVQRTTVNGLPAAYATARANTGQGQVDVTIFAYEFARDRAYHFQAITAAGRSSVFNQMFGSMRRITQAEAGSVIPRRIDVVTVGPRDTVQSLAGRMAYTDGQIERFRVLNGMRGNDVVRAGQKVKLVVYAR